MKESKPTVKRIKTGAFERRSSMAKAGMVAGARLAAQSMTNVFYGKEQRQQRQKAQLGQQAQYLVDEIGKLKGSVVKVGQTMALYGEHFLPDEVTEALHSLEDNTIALAWSVIEPALHEQLGEKFDDFDIDPTPLGAASLAQVHRARRKSDGREVCLKLQYPGVAAAIDSDIDALTQLMRLAKILPKGPDFEAWVEQIRQLLHHEVDYQREQAITARFRERLAGDARFVVPETFPEYGTARLLVTSYEAGVSVSSDTVAALSQTRRNAFAHSMLDLFFQEFFIWHELQTDCNFGNYRLRLSEDGEHDQLVLLDFGAVRDFPDEFMTHFHNVVAGAHQQDRTRLLDGAIGLDFMRRDYPQDVLDGFVRVAYNIIEPFADSWAKPREHPAPAHAVTQDGAYCWGLSELPKRVATSGAGAAFSRHFSIPPGEFLFMLRKLAGVYTFLAVLDARIKAGEVLDQYLVRLDMG